MTSLNTDGIIREFLSYYALDTENSDVNWRSNNQDLLNIALTCRSFRNPALGILWHSLDSLDPLLRLLPQVDWQGGKHPINGSCPKSQARFDYYANKVKAFKFQPAANGETLHISPLPAVSIDKARGYLLRNLQSLFFDLRSAQPEFGQSLDSLLPALLEPTIERITICNSDTHLFDVFPLLSTLRFTCQRVRSISIHGFASDATLRAITSFPKLERCIYTPFHGNSKVPSDFLLPFITALAQMPHLQELTMDITRCTYARFYLPPDLRFTSLRCLSLHGRATAVTNIVNEIESPGISDLDLHLECRACTSGRGSQHVRWEEMSKLMSNMSNRWAHSMNSLKLHLRCNRIEGLCRIKSMTKCLISMNRLHFLELIDDYNRFPSMTNTQEWDLFESTLSQLQVLHLPRSSVLSLPQIHRLLSRLPHLESLGVSISLSEVPSWDALPPLHHGLKILLIRESYNFSEDQKQIYMILGHLHRMAPRLKEIRCPPSMPGWSQVQDMLALVKTWVETQHEQFRISQQYKCSTITTKKRTRSVKKLRRGTLYLRYITSFFIHLASVATSNKGNIARGLLALSLIWLFTTPEPVFIFHILAWGMMHFLDESGCPKVVHILLGLCSLVSASSTLVLFRHLVFCVSYYILYHDSKATMMGLALSLHPDSEHGCAARNNLVTMESKFFSKVYKFANRCIIT